MVRRDDIESLARTAVAPYWHQRWYREDLLQEARMAAWLHSLTGAPPSHIVQEARQAVARAWIRERHGAGRNKDRWRLEPVYMEERADGTLIGEPVTCRDLVDGTRQRLKARRLIA